jgi:L-threonylcarbamoyladenylate synthase
MKIIRAADLDASPALYREIVDALTQDGLACFPAESNYRLVANLLSPDAVMKLMQSKRRAGHHPALVFVTDAKMLRQVVAEVPPIAKQLATAFWPGPLTLLLDLRPDLPDKVTKTLTRATGKVGVRSPGCDVAARVVREFGGPLLVSSANLERKAGAHSLAQVRKNFQQRLTVCVDAGDLREGSPSTLVEITGDEWRIAREGAIPREQIEAALA